MIKQKNLFLILVCLWWSAASVHAQYTIPKKPAKQSAVYDYSTTLSKEDKAVLEQWLVGYSDTTSTQIVVILIPSTKGENLGLLAPRWGHEWGIGQAKEDNGVIVLVDMGGREIWISPGYGLEDKLPAGVTGEIVRNKILPRFKEGRYVDGLTDGILEIMERIAGTYKPSKNASGEPWVAVAVFVLLLLMIAYIVSKKKGDGTNGSGGQRRDSHTMRSNPLFWGGMAGGAFGRGGFGGGSASGGGFSGGFGGGGFSGGGAGGRW